MLKVFCTLIVFVLTASSAFAGAIETLTLIETQGLSDTALLVNSSDTLKSQYYPSGKMPSQILAFYVKFAEQEILFDTGLKNGNIPKELAKNGTAPENVKTILITHLHPDHFGGLVNSEGKPQFPNAEVYVSKPEYEYWVNELKNEAVISALAHYNVKLFAFGDEVVQGVKAMDTAGHTPGHTAFLIEADGDKLIVAGDIMHFPEIQLPNPDVAVKYDLDPVKAVQSRKFILDYAAWKNIPVAGMHITPPGVIQVKKSGNGYEKY